MSPKPEIRESEWLKAVAELSAPPQGFQTTCEIAGELGMSPRNAREKLQQLVSAGRAEVLKAGPSKFYWKLKPAE